MADKPTLLYSIATEMLLKAQDLLREGGLDPVDRAFINVGTGVLAPISLDGATSQLTFDVGPMMPDLITDSRQRREGRAASAMLWKGIFTLTLLRPHLVTGSAQDPLPNADDLDAEAYDHYRDGWQLARGLAYHWMKGTLTTTYPLNVENFQWVSPSVTQVEPQGGIRGWRFKFSISLHDQYQPEQLSPFLLPIERSQVGRASVQEIGPDITPAGTSGVAPAAERDVSPGVTPDSENTVTVAERDQGPTVTTEVDEAIGSPTEHDTGGPGLAPSP